MTREIKFRAWWPSIGEMQFFNDIGFLAPEGDMLMLHGSDMNNEDVYHGFGPRDGQVLMQFTGLKDKNGVEIYEGDIVQLQTPYERGCVFWDVTRLTYSLQRDLPHMHDLLDAGTLRLPSQGEILAVIGNIYENPELVKS